MSRKRGRDPGRGGAEGRPEPRGADLRASAARAAGKLARALFRGGGATLLDLAVVLGASLAFWGPAFAATYPAFPSPLDDVYIYFNFARATASGSLLAYSSSGGYASGATSPLYALVLAAGHLLGARGFLLGHFAGLVAVVALVDFSRSLRRVGLALGAPGPAGALVPFLVVSIPLLDWSFFSGMETAVFAAALGRALVAAEGSLRAPPEGRNRAARRVGAAGALLVLARPEALALAYALSVVAARGAARARGAAARRLAEAFLPALGVTALLALANAVWTGESGAAGAVRKLVLHDPYLGPAGQAAVVLRNLVSLSVVAARALAASGPGAPAGALLVGLFGAALFARGRSSRARPLALALGASALAFLLLVSLNATATHQNFRYLAPALTMLVAASTLGALALAARGLGAAAAALTLALAFAAASLGSGRLPEQTRHFARASKNIAEQQVEVGRLVARMTPRPRRLLVGDAGAIPYVSGVEAIDGLGLGGYRDLPFARASVHGVPAVVELLERLEPSERPDVLALYPGWWPGLAGAFGERVASVRIADNVICGEDEKVVYAADWSTLGPGPSRTEGPLLDPARAGSAVLDAIDVGDLVAEREHALAFSGPASGYVVGASAALAPGQPVRFDAGRLVQEGHALSFVVAGSAAAKPRERARLVLRTDAGPEALARVSVEPACPRPAKKASHPDVRRELAFAARSEARWHEVELPLEAIGPGDRIEIAAIRGPLRLFHVWVLPAAPGEGAEAVGHDP